MAAILIALGFWFALSAPAAAQGMEDYTYDVNFIDANAVVQITGDITAPCDNGACPIGGWQLTVTDILDPGGLSYVLASTDPGAELTGSWFIFSSTTAYYAGGGSTVFTDGSSVLTIGDPTSFIAQGFGTSAIEPPGEIAIGTADAQPLPAPTIGEGLPGLAFGAALILLWRRRWAVL